MRPHYRKILSLATPAASGFSWTVFSVELAVHHH